MKRFYLILLCCALLCCCGCAPKQNSEAHVQFYYRSQSASDSLLEAEARPELSRSATLDSLLTVYLKGPKSQTLTDPFNGNIRLISVTQNGSTLNVLLSREFSRLTRLPLMIACSCITVTCLGLTDATEVTIRAQDSTLDGAESITMDRNTLLLLDDADLPGPERN